MKSKKLFLPTIIIVVAILITAIWSVIISIAKKPTITEGEFPFSITYELDGETVTINDVYKVRYDRNDGYNDTKSRVYIDEIGDMGEGNTIYTLKKDETGKIELWTHFYPDYLMGDAEYYENDSFEPRIYYYDSEGEEYEDEETLLQQGVKLISYEYPTPITNTFVFSHISILSSEIVLPALLLSFLALIAIVIFVKKDRPFVNSPVNIVSTVLNFIIGIVAVPYFTICAVFLDIMGDNDHIVNQAFYFLPTVTILAIAASIALRRKGYDKTALLIEFIGPAVFVILLIIAAIADNL